MSAATLFIRHQVQDYAAWRTEYDAAEALRQQHGCTDAEVLSAPDDKNDLFILHRFPTVEQAEAFAGLDALRAAMERAGVVGAPRIEIAVAT